MDVHSEQSSFSYRKAVGGFHRFRPRKFVGDESSGAQLLARTYVNSKQLQQSFGKILRFPRDLKAPADPKRAQGAAIAARFLALSNLPCHEPEGRPRAEADPTDWGCA
jgi:hypothetical protein